MVTRWRDPRWMGTAHPAQLLVACALLGALWVPARAAAQDDMALDEEARALFDSATLAFQSGRHEVALERFREALELSGRPTLYYNIAIAADRLRRNEEALDAFRMYLAGVPGADNRADVEARIRVLEENLAREQREEAAEEETVAPTPEEVARAADQAEAPAQTVERNPTDDGEAEPITSTWWFWTAVGAVVVGGVALGLALALSDGGVADPLPGSNGASYATLRGGP